MSAQELLENIQNKFSFLFERFGFTSKYTLEKKYPSHIRIGLESDIYPHVKILFVHEWATTVMLGFKDANFEEDLGWFSMRRIVDFVLNRHLRWPPDKITIPYNQFVIIDMSESATELLENCETIFQMFSDKGKSSKWEIDFKKYVTTEIRSRFSR